MLCFPDCDLLRTTEPVISDSIWSDRREFAYPNEPRSPSGLDSDLFRTRLQLNASTQACGPYRNRFFTGRLLCEQLRHVSKCLEFKCVAGWIQEKHGCLLTDLTLESYVRFDLEFYFFGDQTIA